MLPVKVRKKVKVKVRQKVKVKVRQKVKVKDAPCESKTKSEPHALRQAVQWSLGLHLEHIYSKFTQS